MSEPGGDARRPPEPTLFEALLPVLAMFVLFLAGVIFLEFTTELLVSVLVGAAVVAGVVAVRQGKGWEDI